MRIGVVGSRDFDDWAEVVADIGAFVAGLPPETVIVSGGARGVDSIAAEAARARRRLPLVEYRPDWGEHGRFVRNRLIVEHSDEIHAWWDGKSKGTRHTIEYGRQLGRAVTIHEIKR